MLCSHVTHRNRYCKNYCKKQSKKCHVHRNLRKYSSCCFLSVTFLTCIFFIALTVQDPFLKILRNVFQQWYKINSDNLFLTMRVCKVQLFLCLKMFFIDWQRNFFKNFLLYYRKHENDRIINYRTF
jgi:hypothetical protein